MQVVQLSIHMQHVSHHDVTPVVVNEKETTATNHSFADSRTARQMLSSIDSS